LTTHEPGRRPALVGRSSDLRRSGAIGDGMKRRVRTLIQVLASGLILFGGIVLVLEFIGHRLHKAAHINWWYCILGVVLIALGGFLFAGSESLAEQLTDDFEE
jgi:hypothetical protein